MATSSPPHHRVSRKELREPDEFVSLIDAAGDYIADNLPRVIAGAAGLLVLILLGAGWHLYSSHRNQAAAEAFYRASDLYDKKSYKAAGDSFAALASAYSGTSPGRLALLYLGNAYLAQNQAKAARDALQKFLAAEDRPALRQLALLQLGHAYEVLNDPTQARQAYEQSASIKEAAQGRAELALARLTLAQNDKKGAVAIYQRFLQEHPFDPRRAVVVESLSRLGVYTAPVTPGQTVGSPAE